MRAQKPGSRHAAHTMNVATARAIHWSCGQYTPATTGARLKPISITTAPVTAGGSTVWMRPEPATCTSTPTAASTSPATRMDPVTSAESPPWARMAATLATKDALVPR